MQCRRSRLDSWVGKTPWRRDRLPTPVFLGFPGGSDSKESACNAGDLGSILGLGRSPGGVHGNPLQYPCLENSRSLAGCSPWGHKELDATERPSPEQPWRYLYTWLQVSTTNTTEYKEAQGGLMETDMESSILLDMGTSLVVQCLGICLPMQGTRVLPLVWEDPTFCRAWCRARAPQLLSSSSRACAWQQEKPMQRSLHSKTRERLYTARKTQCSWPFKEFMYKKWKPSTAKKKREES